MVCLTAVEGCRITACPLSCRREKDQVLSLHVQQHPAPHLIHQRLAQGVQGQLPQNLSPPLAPLAPAQFHFPAKRLPAHPQAVVRFHQKCGPGFCAQLSAQKKHQVLDRRPLPSGVHLPEGIRLVQREERPRPVDVKFSALPQGLPQVPLQRGGLVFDIFIISVLPLRAVEGRTEGKLLVNPVDTLAPAVLRLPEQVLEILRRSAGENVPPEMSGEVAGQSGVLVQHLLFLIALKIPAPAVKFQEKPDVAAGCELENPDQGPPVRRPGPVHGTQVRQIGLDGGGQRREEKLFAVVQVGQEQQEGAEKAVVQRVLETGKTHPGGGFRRRLFQLHHRLIDEQVPAKALVEKLPVLRLGPFQLIVQFPVLLPGYPVPVQQGAKLVHGRPSPPASAPSPNRRTQSGIVSNPSVQRTTQSGPFLIRRV